MASKVLTCQKGHWENARIGASFALGYHPLVGPCIHFAHAQLIRCAPGWAVPRTLAFLHSQAASRCHGVKSASSPDFLLRKIQSVMVLFMGFNICNVTLS